MSETKVHLCCGKNQLPGWINVDVLDFGQEVICDLNGPWSFLSDNSVDQIFCKDGLEQMDSIEHFLMESERSLRRGGKLHVNVPHFKNPSAYRLTHRHLFSWGYWSAFPEPHDPAKSLRVISNRLTIYDDVPPWRWINAIMNVWPKMWERLLYVSNIDVVLQKS